MTPPELFHPQHLPGPLPSMPALQLSVCTSPAFSEFTHKRCAAPAGADALASTPRVGAREDRPKTGRGDIT